MVKKIITYFIYTLLATGLGVYLYFAFILKREGESSLVCKSVTVTLLDSIENRIVSKSEVISIIDSYNGKVIGKNMSEINVAEIERLLNIRSAIKEAQVSITRGGDMSVEIMQRKPILRIETKNGGFYVDETEYIFPLVDHFTSYVPIVNGHIPLAIDNNHRGVASDDINSWMHGILELGRFINGNKFWDSQIEQIYVDKSGDIIFYPRVGDHKIIFGEAKDIEDKFNKLYTFYKNAIPNKGWSRYKSINLKYKDQIVCKLNKGAK